MRITMCGSMGRGALSWHNRRRLELNDGGSSEPRGVPDLARLLGRQRQVCAGVKLRPGRSVLMHAAGNEQMT